MPDLNFEITGVEAAAHGITPLLHFQLRVTNEPAEETIQSIILQAQIQIQSTRRSYTAIEKEKLGELFGTPDRWGQTLRTRLWTHATTVVRTFTGSTEAILPVPCTYDFNVASAKYFDALGDGSVPLLFLFSGTIFYTGSDGRLQIQQVSWEKESAWAMPVGVWRGLMEHHYPHSAWLSLHREIFDQLLEFKRREGLVTWEQAIERLLAQNVEVVA